MQLIICKQSERRSEIFWEDLDFVSLFSNAANQEQDKEEEKQNT